MKSKDEAFLHLQPEDGDGQHESICLATCGCALHRDYQDTGDPAFVMCAGHRHAYHLLFTPAGSSSAARAAAEVLFGRAESFLNDEGVDGRVCREVAQDIVAAIGDRRHVKITRGRLWRCRCGEGTRVDYGQLAEAGVPMCAECDREMELADEEGDESDRSSLVARPHPQQLPQEQRPGHSTTG